MVAAIAGTTQPFAVELRAPQGSTTKLPSLAHSCTYNGSDGPEVADPPARERKGQHGRGQVGTDPGAQPGAVRGVRHWSVTCR